MDTVRPEPPAVEYASTPADAPTQPSFYGLASIFVSAASVAWFFLPGLVFSAGKQDRVGQMGSVVGILLAVAGWQRPHRYRYLFHIGLSLGIAGFCLYCLFPTL
jgi:hypothetical protein